MRRVLLIAVLLLAPSAARGQVFLEARLGLQGWTGDAAEIAGPGIVLGCTMGYLISDHVGIELRGDFSSHSELDDSPLPSDYRIHAAVTVAGRYYPVGIREHGTEYFLLGQAGGGSLRVGIEDTSSDQYRSWILGGGGGVSFPLLDDIDLGAEGLVNHHMWDSETQHGIPTGDFGGWGYTLTASLRIVFR